MTLQEAYRRAIDMRIKDLPHIAICCGLTKLYLRENTNLSKIVLTVDFDDEFEGFYITTEELLSEDWTVQRIEE